MQLQFLVTVEVHPQCDENKELVAMEIFKALRPAVMEVQSVKLFEKSPEQLVMEDQLDRERWERFERD